MFVAVKVALPADTVIRTALVAVEPVRSEEAAFTTLRMTDDSMDWSHVNFTCFLLVVCFGLSPGESAIRP
jgi:hypothetical protein